MVARWAETPPDDPQRLLGGFDEIKAAGGYHAVKTIRQRCRVNCLRRQLWLVAAVLALRRIAGSRFARACRGRPAFLSAAGCGQARVDDPSSGGPGLRRTAHSLPSLTPVANDPDRQRRGRRGCR
jgi:hypothetical protein